VVDKITENKTYINLLQHPIYGEPGRKYLEFRGITEETVKRWEIGYVPMDYRPNWSDENDPFDVYSKMQGRIKFPIYDVNGELVSVSGRLALQLDKPKYDMHRFIKNRVLFGLYQNKYNIREQNNIIITEGQLDVISAWQNGITNVVSSFGAHCSLYHLGLAARYCSDVYILYDEDMAGLVGAESINEFSTHGDLNINIKNGIFQKGDDLDSFVRKHSREEFYKLLNIV
jgi:DNA primase